MKRGKKYVEAAKNIDRQTLYEAADAISLVKKNDPDGVRTHDLRRDRAAL